MPYNTAYCQKPYDNEHDLRQSFCVISNYAVLLDATEKLAANVQVEHCTNADRAKKADNESLARLLDLMNLFVHSEDDWKSAKKQNQYPQWDEAIDGDNVVVCKFVPRCDCTKPDED